MAWTAIILAVVILSLTFLPNASSLAIVILLGMIKKKIKTTADRSPPSSAQDGPPSPPSHPDSPASGRTWPLPGSSRPAGQPPPSCALPPAGPPSQGGALPGASPPRGPPRTGNAPRPMVDALVPSGKKRSKPESSSTPSSSSGFEHDVYLNFRGLDTREGFTDHLYHALKDAGIKVFIDDGELHPGEEMGSKLKEAIKRSRISIAILSINYASSTRCLNELVQMWECRESNGQRIIPIYYNVSPSDVGHQAGDFGRSFNLHEMDRVDSITIETWRDVLRNIVYLPGLHWDEILNGHEGRLVEDLVKRVLRVLNKDYRFIADRLFGIDHHVQEMMRKLGVANSKGQAIEVRGEEVRVVGICGEPGVGKTTLAKVVFNKMHKLFDACSFLEGISSEEIEFSRRMLIADLHKVEPAPLKSIHEGIEEIASLCRNAKVLIVLDNVREDEQIKALAGKLTWFGPGSRIIVTTTKRNVLNAFDDGALAVQTVEEYNLVPMKDHHALQLFREHAFAGEAPEDVSEFDSLSTDIVKAIGGLPSDIVHHASFLYGNRNIDIWKASLDILQKKTQKIGNLPY